MYKGWCTRCQKWHETPVDFSKQVLGQGRIGVRLASMIAYLPMVMRLPLRQLRDVLRDLHSFEVSLGEIVELLHRITEHAQPVLTTLKAAIRASPARPRGCNQLARRWHQRVYLERLHTDHPVG